ncbi:hypothetical protein CEXT_752041 [Caerostris extrusa]|uniref:Uncharacterized protein n=1 Tax=Caerostris extrusa TaxID=172846 RepID=A0AAV4Y7Y0_CAEEX|nr:hypothetical protein CEXT_752041 [Caerostris extrusa]
MKKLPNSDSSRGSVLRGDCDHRRSSPDAGFHGNRFLRGNRLRQLRSTPSPHRSASGCHGDGLSNPSSSFALVVCANPHKSFFITALLLLPCRKTKLVRGRTRADDFLCKARKRGGREKGVQQKFSVAENVGWNLEGKEERRKPSPSFSIVCFCPFPSPPHPHHYYRLFW